MLIVLVVSVCLIVDVSIAAFGWLRMIPVVLLFELVCVCVSICGLFVFVRLVHYCLFVCLFVCRVCVCVVCLLFVVCLFIGWLG